ncbi:uncharacterized protein LOC124927797 [Impatiens glandulifera]|uniref:uncharacterized protein LOC124927797 n=1 Tax=Impatiens glandulifera TaxID=253017 RepID=UPI001FB0EE14|nr:uncharacterized protein LOC124927797 [Impatiens glandulifera]
MLHMDLKETCHHLLVNSQINPDFTEIVWKHLEQENKEFFKAYLFRLNLMAHIRIFNYYLQKQSEIIAQLPTGVPALVSPENHVSQCGESSYPSDHSSNVGSVQGKGMSGPKKQTVSKARKLSDLPRKQPVSKARKLSDLPKKPSVSKARKLGPK